MEQEPEVRLQGPIFFFPFLLTFPYWNFSVDCCFCSLSVCGALDIYVYFYCWFLPETRVRMHILLMFSSLFTVLWKVERFHTMLWDLLFI